MKKLTLCTLTLIVTLLYVQDITAQSWKWAAGSKSPKGFMETWLVAADGSGNVYSCGFASPIGLMPNDSIKSIFGPFTVGDTTYSSEIMFLVSTDSNGNYRWAEGLTQGEAQIEKITTDVNNDVHIFGTFSDTIIFSGKALNCSPGNAAFYAKLNSSGKALSLNKVADSSNGWGGCTDVYGNTYIAGNFSGHYFKPGTAVLTNNGNVNTYDDFITKYDPSGNLLWAKSFGGDSSESVVSVKCTYNGDVFIAGNYKSPSFTVGSTTFTNSTGGLSNNYFIIKYDKNGNFKWGKNIVPYNSLSYLSDIDLDIWGNVYSTGSFEYSIFFDGLSLTSVPKPFAYRTEFVTKFNSNGVPQWAKTVSDDNFPQGFSIAADACGNVWVSGGGVSWASSDPSFILRYDSSGTLIDSMVLASGGDDPNGIAIDNKGNLYFGGDYLINDFVIGNDTLRLSDSTEETLFIARYSYPFCALNTHLNTDLPEASTSAISLFPNPAYDECTISNGTGNSQLTRAVLSDLTGRVVQTYSLSGSSTTIDIRNILPGVYLCRIFTEDNTISTRKLVVGR